MKEKMTKMFLVLSTLLSAMMATGNTIRAETKMNAVLDFQARDDWHDASRDGSAWGEGGFFVLSGRKNYCVEPKNSFLHGTSYNSSTNWDEWFKRSKVSQEVQQKIALASIYGYGYKNSARGVDRTGDIWFNASQSLVWWYIMEAQGYNKNSWTFSKPKNYSFDQMEGYINQVKADVENHNKVPNLQKKSGAGSISGTNIKLRAGETIVLEDKNAVLSFFQVSAGNDDSVKLSKSKNELTISVTANSKNSVTLNFQKLSDKNIGTSDVYYPTSDTSKQVMSPLDKTTRQVKFSVKVETEKLGNLKIVKKDADGNPVIGAEFVLTGPNSYKKEFKISKTDGSYEIKDLPIGKYKLQETKTLEYLILDVTEHGTTVETNKTTTITIVNEFALGDLEIKKSNTDGGAVVGAKFILTGPYGFKEEFEIEEPDGTYKFKGLRIGTYTLKEIYTPNEFVMDDKEIEVVVKKDKLNQIEVKNEFSVGSLKIAKADTDGVAVSGVEFQLTGPYDFEETFKITNEDGTFEFENLRIGTYVLKEISTLSNLVLYEKEIEVQIEKDKKAKITVINEFALADLRIIKVDTDNKSNVLEGAEFILLDSTKKEIAKNKTGEDGIALFTDLRHGTYYLKEIIAPKGFQLNEELLEVKIDENYSTEKPCEITIENKKLPVIVFSGDEENSGLYMILGSMALLGVCYLIGKKH